MQALCKNKTPNARTTMMRTNSKYSACPAQPFVWLAVLLLALSWRTDQGQSIIATASAFTISLPPKFVSNARHLRLKMKPLIGGPSWLPLHVQVVVAVDANVIVDESGNHGKDSNTRREVELVVVDFIPLNATSSATLQKLITLQDVPGQIRIFDYRDGTGSQAVQISKEPSISPSASSSPTSSMIAKSHPDAMELAESVASCAREYSRKDLHLINHNCWTFAWNVMLGSQSTSVKPSSITTRK
uniref:Uncharacterized protein n=1 Tax=Craspedostauros australis TaxID=1486917 RepID=A0A7R9ZN28_9STRA|mmetsp:Transcript_21481/g.59766  ORF Transcript_21481/g.59766 Transcript_21481/m.59766 type:complete len:244 (+) Transcript_21481:277-1008(+)